MSGATEAAERLIADAEARAWGTHNGPDHYWTMPADILTVARALRSAEQRVAELEAALDETRRSALCVVGASEAYGETESAHLWQEVADIADAALARPAATAEEAAR